jgi:hypothetical protein
MDLTHGDYEDWRCMELAQYLFQRPHTLLYTKKVILSIVVFKKNFTAFFFVDYAGFMEGSESVHVDAN